MPNINRIKGKLLWLVPSILALTLYFQTRTHTYISYDDAYYTYETPEIFNGLTWDSIKWSLTESYFANYHPVTWWSHMLDFMLFGNSPGMFALENGLIHTLNVLLVTLLLAKIFKSKSEAIIGGLIFAVHPVLIEAVAWISQRKTLLSTFWVLLSMILYLRYIDCNKTKAKFSLYISSIICFIISLLSKSMYVTLPALLVLLQIMHEDQKKGISENFSKSYLKNNLLPLFLRLLPYGILTIVFAFIAIWAQSSGGAVSSLDQMSIVERMENVLYSYSTYVKQFFYPHRLSFLYEIRAHFRMIEFLSYGIFLISISSMLYTFRNRLGIKPIVGWFYFLASLLPVIGIVQIGNQSHADRYMYGPIIGLIISVLSIGNFAKSYLKSTTIKFISTLSVSLWMAFLSIDSYFYIGHWENNMKISVENLKYYPNNPVARHIFATELMRRLEFEKARDILLDLCKTHPDKYLHYSNLALCEYSLGNYDKAIEYQLIFMENTKTPGAGLVNLAKFYTRWGRYEKAKKIMESISLYDYKLSGSELVILEQIKGEIEQNTEVE